MDRQHDKEILVYADWANNENAQLIGILSASMLRGKEYFSFEYDLLWLNKTDIRALDPALHLFEGLQFAPQGHRIHFASAMTLLQHQDGDDASSGVSYLHLAEFIMREGAEPERDLEQLWRRIIFFVCISNVDDHLRNHGFLLQPNGWVLSPAYDINPVAHSDGLKLNISESDNTQSLALVRSVAPYFRISDSRADSLIAEMLKVIKEWRKIASKLGISQSEQMRMASAFRLVD